MKKFSHYITENKDYFGLNSCDDDFLRDRKESLMIHLDELQDEISQINNILTSRKEKKQSDYSANLPESIFDFNEEQSEFIFAHYQGETAKKYQISQQYIGQLTGVITGSFNPETKQFKFDISTYQVLQDDSENYIISEDMIKTIKFLGDNLKKHDGYVKFGIIMRYNHHSYGIEIRYVSDSSIAVHEGRYAKNEFKSIKTMMDYLVREDLSQRESDY